MSFRAITEHLPLATIFGSWDSHGSLFKQKRENEELANHKLEGALSADQFQRLMAEILGGGDEISHSYESPDAATTSNEKETAEPDYSIAIAGALGIAGLAAMVLLVVFVLAR